MNAVRRTDNEMLTGKIQAMLDRKMEELDGAEKRRARREKATEQLISLRRLSPTSPTSPRHTAILGFHSRNWGN